MTDFGPGGDLAYRTLRPAPRLTWRELPCASIPIAPEMINLPATLSCGQAFRWQSGTDGWWYGVVDGTIWRLQSRDHELQYQCFPERPDAEVALGHYFRFEVDLSDLYRAWRSTHPAAVDACRAFSGLRVLHQDPDEALFSYVCSAASSVRRISYGVAQLSRVCGSLIAVIDQHPYYAFPSRRALAEADSADLRREARLGWRADALVRLAKLLIADDNLWRSDEGRRREYRIEHQHLCRLPGIGPKIADCTCLFGCAYDEAVPVDRHIWALARELFPSEITGRSLTPATYWRVSDLFQNRFGPYAGWAQEYLYHWRRTELGLASTSPVEDPRVDET